MIRPAREVEDPSDNDFTKILELSEKLGLKILKSRISHI